MRCSAAAVAWTLGVAALGASAPGRANPEGGLAPETCVACRADVEGARASFSAEQWAQLIEGEVITSDLKQGIGEQARHRSRASGIIAHPPELVWTVLTDFTSWPTFFPNVVETLVRRVEGRRVRISQHLRVAFVNVRFGAIWTLDPAHGLGSFQLDEQVPHDIAASEGAWQLLPIDGGAATLVVYRSEVETGRPVPAFVENLLLKRSLPNAVRGLRDEVARRASEPGPSAR